MNSTGKAARRRHGTRVAAKASKGRKRRKHKTFGSLPVSVIADTAAEFVRRRS